MLELPADRVPPGQLPGKGNIRLFNTADIQAGDKLPQQLMTQFLPPAGRKLLIF